MILALRRVEERQRMFRGIVDWLGFRKARLDFEAPDRQYGTPVYSYGKLLNLALNSFISYSSLPLKTHWCVGNRNYGDFWACIILDDSGYFGC